MVLVKILRYLVILQINCWFLTITIQLDLVCFAITDARTRSSELFLLIDVSNKVDTGSSNDRIGIDVDVIGDVSGNTIRDAVAIRAVSRQSTGAEVTRLNTPIHAILDMANTLLQTM